MADESNKKAESSNASDILKSLTLGVNPEMAESAKKLVIAMKNASEEEYNALLKMLSNSNTPDADEKPSVKDEGNVVLPGDAQLDGNQPEVFVKNEGKGEDHEESTSENLENDLNELENGENGYNADSEKLPDNISSTSNSFTSKAPEVSSKCDKPDDELLSMGENSGVDQLEVINDKSLNNETSLPELSDEAKKQADKFPSTGEKSADAQFEGANDNSDSVSNLLKLSLEAENLPKMESTMDKCFPDSQFEATESNSFCDTEGFKLPELSLEHGRLADQLDTVGRNSYGDVHGEASSSDSEELPELLSNKAEDTCSEIEDGENNELSGTSIAQIDASRQNRSIEDLTPSMQANSHTNLLSGTTETEKDFSKRSSYELSSDDDHVTSSSSNLELTSTGSELSDEVAPSDTILSRRLDIDGKNPDDNVSSSSVTEIRDVNTVNGDDPVQKEGRNEPAAEGVHVTERLSPIQSTGTQTSTEPEKHLHKEHLANEPICVTSGGGFDREGLDSILGFKDKGSSKLPFYYQPQIVMHEHKPVLVLQPVSLSSLLPSESNVDVSGAENDGIKARVPIILPLTSPDFDEATKDAILKKINEESDKNKIDDSLMQGYSGEISSLSTISTFGKNSEAGSSSSVRPDITKVNGKPVADKSSKVSIEGLPEWVPSCELDRAFSAVTEQDTSSTTVETSSPLTFPTVSLPSTNPFAKDLAALHTRHGDGKVEDLSNPGLDKSLQQSLFGPPTPSSVASGARPKQMKAFPEAGHVGTATNPFTPDLTPKKRGKRQQQGVTDHSTAVVVSAEVHPSVSQSGVELNRPLPRSPRPRLSSESMVTVIETTYADTPASSAEMLSLPNDEPNKIEVVPVDHNTQLESRETLPETTKPKLRVPGKVAPFWIPDFACSNCTHCNARFTVFLRKHHCRACGKIFCKNCCSQLASFPYMDHKVGRVCPSCTEAIREVHRSKKIEKTADRQNMSQTVNAPGQGLVISGTPAQRNSQQQSRATSSTTVPLNPGLQRNQSNMPGTSQQVPIASSSGMVSLSQETQRSLPKRAVPYQPLSIPSVRAQNPALQSTGQPQGPQQPQGLQSVMQPAQPANQYMWVPASSLFVNPVAPTLQGGPVLVPAAPFTPQQAPVVLMPPSQPPSSLHLSQAATKPLNTMALGGPRGETTVANTTSSETVSTFSVLPQHVGQTATQSAQSSYAGSVEQPLLTSRQASCTVGSESSRGVLPESPSLSQSRVQATSVPGKLPSTASSSPIIAGHPSVTLQQQFSIPPVNQAGQSPQQPSGVPPSTFLPHSSPETVSPTPHQTKPASATFVSSPRRSSPSTTAVSPSQRSPPAAANSLREGTVIQAGQFRPHPTGHPSPTSLPLSSSQTVSPSPHQTKSAASATSVSSPSTTATSPTRRSPPHAAANSSREGSENQESQRPRPDDGSSLFSDETGAESKDFKPPLRRAGRTITWRYRTQGKSKLQMHKKSLAKDLRDLPDGVKIQAAADLIVHVKKMKVREKNREILVWCYQSEGLNKFRHLEVVVMLEVRKKEEIFPEEVLRVYRGILHLASKLGNSFQHGNYLSSNDQFLDSLDDAGFIFVSSEVKPKPPGLRQIQGPFLYGLLVKRLELQAAMFTPSRLLLRMGYDMKSFPFPLWNCRDRKPIYLGNENQDRFFHTVFAMNKYLKNSVPEAMVPGLCVVKEDNKVVLQIPNSGQTAVVNLLDRLIKKENQTATVPLVSDIPPYVDNCQVVICNERGGRSIQSFGNPACASVQGLGFLMLHLGVDASSPLSFGGELLDDGVLVFFSKGHTQKLRQSLEEKTNCYFYLGDRFDISHFELRWVQDINYDDMPETELNGSLTNSHPAPTTSADTPAKEPGADYYPGLATIDIRYSGYGSEIGLLKEVFEDHTKILHILEGNIRRACTEPLMKHESKMKAGEHLDLQLRVVLKPSYKKWSIGPNDLPTALIRSLQMALSTVKVPVVSEGELVMSFDVGVFKQ